MNVALTGSSGFIGAAVATQLARAGHHVTSLVRASSETAHIESVTHRFVRGDQADPSVWSELLDGADAVVHNSFDWDALKSGSLKDHLSSNLDASLMFLDAAHEAGVHRFVYMSSVAVHHAMSERWGGVIDEDHPLRPSGLYGACKAAIEAHLWSAMHCRGMHAVSIRPAAVYGVEPVRRARSHGFTMVRKLLKGDRITPADFPGGGKWIHVEDVALATVRAIERDDASGHAFNLADCYCKHTQVGAFAAEALGLPADMVEIDDSPPAKNRFDKTATQQILGVEMDRGEAGIRDYVRELVSVVRSETG